MKSIASLVLVFASISAMTLCAQARSRPNVIVMMADDLGFGDLSCYGGERMKTPELDKLASSGARLTSFYAGATVCTPSRMALMAGCYPTRLGWTGGVLGYKMETETGLAPEVKTMAEVFKDAGYRTALSGKWHLGSSPDLLPSAQGFDQSFFIKMSNNQTKKLWRDDKLVADPFDNRRLTEQFTEQAIKFIRAESEEPFFLYLPFTAPHFPAEAHPDWKGKSNNGAYGDVVEELDARVGEIISALRERKIEGNTIVVLLSDNGPDGSQRKFATAKPYRGGKWSSLEGGTRVPCIVSWPGVVPAGKESAELISAIDLLPTLAHAAGLDWKGEGIDGVNVWPAMIGQVEPSKHAHRDLLYWEGWATPQAIRSGKWKLYFDEVKGVKGSKLGPVLFDLSTDLQEEKNLAAVQPDKVTELMVLARKRLAEVKADPEKLGGAKRAGKRAVPKSPRWLQAK